MKRAYFVLLQVGDRGRSKSVPRIRVISGPYNTFVEVVAATEEVNSRLAGPPWAHSARTLTAEQTAEWTAARESCTSSEESTASKANEARRNSRFRLVSGAVRYRGNEGKWVRVNPGSPLFSTALMCASHVYDGIAEKWKPVIL
jgi:hypothetical protein